MEPYVIDVNRLVNDIKGYIAQLKSTYFENKDPIDDNEIVLQKLCVKLETALRHGMRDKFSFLGMRKDYWNFFAECLPKDEGVRYVNSLSQLHTVQGKGRALIRYCLVQKTLADTIQRTLMHRKKTEWYTPEALLINSSLSAALIAKLYDLNELEFHLSCTGCDLDMSWPSFGRSFTDGYEKRTRRNSAGSIASTTDFTNERTDPLIALNAEISALKQMISRELDNDKDDGIGESSMSSTEEQQPNVSEITLEISRLHQFILKWKSSNDAKVYKAEHEIERLLEENNRLSQDSSAQLTQLAEKHQNLSDLASKEATLQIIDLQNKLRNAETTIGEHKTKLNSLNKELETVSEHYENSQKTIKDLKKDLSGTQESTNKLENEICLLKEKNETQKTECGKLKEENNNIRSELQSSQHSEALLRNKLEESESKLHIKTLEKDKIQEAFENVNGLVFGSFEDFESYYKSQLLDKEKGLEIKDSENKTLQQRLVQLTCDNEKLKCELQNALDKTPQDEHEEKTEQSQTQEMDKIASELDMLLDTIEKANVNVSKWLHHSTDREESSDMTSAEDKCKKLTNNLNELDIHLKTDKETLANIVEEKDKFESQCKSSALEMERLIQLNEELEKEKTASLVDKQDQEKDNAKLENQIHLLTAENTKFEDAVNSLRNEKSDIDSEIQTLNEKLQEESYSKLELESEVTEITELLNKEKSEKADSLKEIERLKMEIEAAETKCEELKDELVKSKKELDSVSANLSSKENELEKVNELLGNTQKEKEELERKQANYEEQRANLQCTMEQQVSSLRFQLSSEALKYDEEIKVLSEEKQEAIALRDKIQEHEETITELENKLKERNETWQTEKKKLTSDIKLLKSEIKVLNENIDADKQEIQSVENTLMLSKKKYEKEKSRNQEYRKTMQEIKDQKSENEKILEQEKSELEEDVKQLKSKLISLLSDKSELWKRSSQLEFDMKTRLSETWVEDKDVTQCPQCNNEFTLFVRKHHCRFCGNVFCNNCSYNFVKTIHSRKPYRACNSCYQKEKEMKTDTSWLSNTSLNQDDSTLDSNGSDTEENLTSTPNKMAEDVTKRKNRSERVDTKDSSDFSDDSDENFQVIDEADVSEDSLSSSFKNSSLSVEHSARLKPGDGAQDWNEATIPAGKRYLMNVEVSGGCQYVVQFTTSEQDILFGAAMQETDSSRSKTLISLCQISSHERCAKKQINVTSSGILMLVFDNTHSKSSIQQLRFKINLKKPINQTRKETK